MQYVPDTIQQRARQLQPDLDEVLLEQQLITLVPTIFSVTISVLLIGMFLVAGVPSIAIGLFAIGFSQAVLYVAAVARPQLATTSIIGVGLVVIVVNFYLHGVAGGFSGGFWALAWLPLVPLTVYFVAGKLGGGFVLALTLAMFVAAALLDPVFARSTLDIPYTPRMIYNIVTLCIATLMSYLWAQFLIDQLGNARQQADNLLLNILPGQIASRLKKGEATIADSCEAVTVLFADIVDFTTMSAAADPVDVVNKLNEVFSDFDELATKHGLEKIKTIGDAYMVAGGLPDPQPDHVEAVAAFAVDMIEAVGRHRSWSGEPIRLRVGINTGPVVAGVIGRRKFIYDLWGDAVNVASRMESNGLSNEIQVTQTVADQLEGRYNFEPRDPIDIKGKGLMQTYLLRPL